MIISVIQGHNPDTTRWGIVISMVSIVTMHALIRMKTFVGRRLNSEPILADANCTKVCFYMSIVLLISSFLYEVSGIGFLDSIGALGLAYFSFNEGREAFEKALGKNCGCEENCGLP